MSKLKPRIKRVSLAFMGEGWQEAYVDFKALRWADVAELQGGQGENRNPVEILIEALRRNFSGGKGVDEDGSLFDLSADDLGDFDLDAINSIADELAGRPDPNA
ncbi:MAG: hypothetical protein M3Q03_20035 [Chloroflexota bacterium]|nr:hypothetical protein [Chloroflexota bacterium]